MAHQSMRTDSGCPNSETLAELAEGLLEEPRRQDVLGHLAECVDCYETYKETQLFLASEEDKNVVPLIPKPQLRQRNLTTTVLWGLGGLAAAALLIWAVKPLFAASGAKYYQHGLTLYNHAVEGLDDPGPLLLTQISLRPSKTELPKQRSGLGELSPSDRRAFLESALAFEEAHKKDPENVDYLLTLVSCWMITGNTSKAESLLKGQSSQDPLVRMATILAEFHVAREISAEEERLAEILMEMKALQAQHPNIAQIHYNLGQMLELMDQGEEAVACWQSFLQLEPHGIYADEARRYLDAHQ